MPETAHKPHTATKKRLARHVHLTDPTTGVSVVVEPGKEDKIPDWAKEVLDANPEAWERDVGNGPLSSRTEQQLRNLAANHQAPVEDCEDKEAVEKRLVSLNLAPVPGRGSY